MANVTMRNEHRAEDYILRGGVPQSVARSLASDDGMGT